jgi:putative nucleotidyltransferase with HDIG domain
MGSMNRREALKMIEGSSRYAHSVLVGKVMVIVARRLGGDEEEWKLVGLLHDLDYDAVQGNMTQHGVRAAESLSEKVSDEGLDAIRSHDHRAGFKPKGLLAESLRFADTVAVIMEDQRLQGPVEEAALRRAIRGESSQKPWIEEIIVSFRQAYGVQLSEVLNELSGF